MPDYYQIVLSIVAVVVAVYGVHEQRKQTRMMETQALSRPAKRRGEVPRVIWWRSPAIIVLLILMCLTWGPFVISKSGEEERLHASMGIKTGTFNNSTGKLVDATIYVGIDGNEIYKYSPARVMAAAFVWMIDQNPDDVGNLQKSVTLDIRKGQIEFLFRGDQTFLDQINHGAPINYVVIILPKNVSRDSFATLQQAKDLGARVISIGSQA